MQTTAGAARADETQRGAARREMSPQAKAAWEQKVAATKVATATQQALAIAGLVGDGGVVCPECRRAAPRGKFKIHPDGGWKHFSSEGCSGDAIGILKGHGLSFGDAVRALNGLPTRADVVVPENLDAVSEMFVGQRSKVNVEVFNGVLTYGRKTGGVEAAQEFYGKWHISPEAVERSGAVYITNPKHFAAAIQERFGLEVLLECGLFVMTKRGPMCLISESFPLVEPHRHPATGDVLYMQLRGSEQQQARHLEHKRDPKNVPYRGHEKFISLRGAPRAAQVGCNLHLIEELPAGSDVYIVEGFKDGLAGMSLGLPTYGIPGVDFRPPEKICQLLSQHKVFVALDGDQAGIDARDGKDVLDEDGNVIRRKEGLVEYLRGRGVDAVPQAIGGGLEGMDLTDFLVAGFASGRHTGGVPHDCIECDAMRSRYPQQFVQRTA